MGEAVPVPPHFMLSLIVIDCYCLLLLLFVVPVSHGPAKGPGISVRFEG